MIDSFSSGLDPARGPGNEFGELARQSGRILNELSHAQIAGAQNLLKKAIRELDSGEAKRAGQLIQRAALMPYDPREAGSPGVRAATLLVYEVISDQFEASDPADTTWLDVVLDVHPRLDPTGRAEVASVVHGFVSRRRSSTSPQSRSDESKRSSVMPLSRRSSGTGRTRRWSSARTSSGLWSWQRSR